MLAAQKISQRLLRSAPSPKQKDLIWVGTDDGRIHITRDGGKNWESVEKNIKGVPANTWIPHIRASKYDAGCRICSV